MVQERSLHNGCMALPVCHPARRVREQRPALLEEKSLFGLSKVARPGTSMRFGPKKSGVYSTRFDQPKTHIYDLTNLETARQKTKQAGRF